MKFFNLGDIDTNYIDKVGGKARGLDRLIKGGFSVPKGFVLFDIDLKTDLNEAVRLYEKANLGIVAVRSSASVEDGENFSFAGQFATVLNVSGNNAFKDALIKCVESLSTKLTDTYSKNFAEHETLVTMSVVVQSMLAPSCAGVVFTANPQNKNQVLVEAVEGIGEALVSGEKAAVQYVVSNSASDLEDINTEFKNITPPLTQKLLHQIVTEALRVQTFLGGAAQDLEWAIEGDKLYWLQTRPITTTDIATDDEFNFKGDLTGHAVTKFNIGEMLPGAVTPLSLSTTVYAIDWGIRKMLHLVGANKKMQELDDFACVFSSYGHLFMNLTTLYRIANTTLLAKKSNIDFSICDKELTGEDEGIIVGKKRGFFPRLHYSVRYLSFIMSYKKAMKKIDKLAENFTIADDGTIEGLYNAIDASLIDVNYSALLHYVTSGHGGAMSSATTNVLEKRLNNTEKSRGILAQMLECIDNIESADILNSLLNIAKEINADSPKAKNFSTEELKIYLESSGEKVKSALSAFMKRHGHRTVREAELRNKSWATDDEAFLKHLKTVICANMPSKKPNETPPNLKQIAIENGFKKSEAGKVAYFAKQARVAVVNREFSKAKLIKIFDVLKQAYSVLAKRLLKSGKISDTDLIYFFTHKEIGQLIKAENPSLTKKALQRCKVLKQQSTLTFKDVYVGMPSPVVIVHEACEGGITLSGTPVSRGVVSGKARVVKSIEDAEKLQEGEIMVAAFTDIGWSPFYCLIDGLVTEVGSALSHGAVVAREYALPLVANVTGATQIIKTGDTITVDGNKGTVVKSE